jgi:GNAT superfamily N-acetyltransferase
MAWSTTHPFHVEEIGATFDPRGGVYLFGDFVDPAHRGKKLQRALVSHRLAAARDQGLPFAYTLIHPSNAASLRSYAHEHFVPAARFTRYHWLRKKWCHCAQLAAPSGTLVPRFKIDATDTLSPM